MPRTARASVAGMWYHVLNRGNRRDEVFHKPADFDAFVKAIADAHVRLPVDVLGYCLMPNHFHLLIRTRAEGDLGRWVQWLLIAHARRYHRHYGTSGHVWQGRFKAFPVQDDDHLVGVLRYIERNPLRAELVARAEDWKWSSLPRWSAGDPLLWRGVAVRDERWLERVNEPLSAGDLQRLRLSVERGRPYGDDAWAKETARRLGLESTLRSRGGRGSRSKCVMSPFPPGVNVLRPLFPPSPFPPLLCPLFPLLELHRAGRTSGEIADRLNAEGFRPAKRRETFNRAMVRQMLSRHIRSGPRPRALSEASPLEDREWWLTDLARELGMPTPTVHCWLRRGWITARKLTGAGGRWILWADDQELDRLRRLRARPRGWADQPYPPEVTTPKAR